MMTIMSNAELAKSPAGFLRTTRGKLTLVLLCAVAFLDFVDASIVNVALPAVRKDLHMSVQDLQWVPSAYLLTYGSLMLLGGRAADLLGRRRVLVGGAIVFAASSLTAGFAGNAGVLVGSRLAQGVGAALMLPAALSILTTSFSEGSERNTALGAWGGMGGLASAVGVLAGGVLADGPGWRWVMFVNPPVCVAVIVGAMLLVGRDHRAPTAARRFDAIGAALSTVGMLALVFTLVKAPDVGWATTRTIGGFVGAAALLILFVANEHRTTDPLLPLSIFRVRGLAAADTTQLIAVAGLTTMFFVLTVYMQTVLGYSPIRTGLAYLPVTVGVGMAAGLTSQLVTKIGTKPPIIAGALLSAAGVLLLARIPVDGSYVADLLPGMLLMSVGLGTIFVAVTTAANAGVPPERAGVAAALLNASQQVGGAFGLAVLTALATSRTQDLLATGIAAPDALTSGFRWALTAAGAALVIAALIASGAPQARPSESAPLTQQTIDNTELETA